MKKRNLCLVKKMKKILLNNLNNNKNSNYNNKKLIKLYNYKNN